MLSKKKAPGETWGFAVSSAMIVSAVVTAAAVVVSSVATVIDADAQGGALPVLSTSSPTAKGATRRWQRTADFVREVSDARIHGGIHFRSATDAAEAMGRRIGELAVRQVMNAAP